MPATQEGNPLGITTPLGKDALILWSFTGQEEMSRLFTFQLGMLSPNCGIDPLALVGKPVTARIGMGPRARVFHGYVRRFAAGGMLTREFRGYHAEVVPWLWFLTRRTGCRIFQQKTAKQIVEAIFSELGFSEFQFQLGRTPAIRNYCVQYRETDFAFVSRLLEEEGIFYFFKHADGAHTMVLSDQVAAYQSGPTLDYVEGSPAAGTAVLTSWNHQYEFRSGKFAHTDYDFESPSLNLLTSASTVLPLAGTSKYELYDHPGEYLKSADGTALAKIRMEEEETPWSVVSGGGSCADLVAGGKLTVGKNAADRSESGKCYVVTAVEHRATDESRWSEGAKGTYQNSFRAIPDSVIARPARETPRPVVRGCHTAIVVGPAGEEIYTDKYGRVKVQFRWDREGKKDDKSTCWMRVSQDWAGKGFGAYHHPRIGQEVLVDFLEGDPDQPVILGRVHNAEQMPPYALPSNQTRSGIKTRSSPGGTEENFNEIRFEDKKGSEEIYVHAEKDFNRVVENNDTLKVGMDKKDPGTQSIDVWGDRTETVHDGNESVTIKKGNRTVTVETGNDTHEVQTGNRTVIVKTGDDTHEVSTGKRTVTVKDKDALTVQQGDHTLQVDQGNVDQKIKMGNRAVTLDMGNDTLTITMGNQTTKLDLGKQEVQAMQSIELKVGGSSVKIDQMGVTIKGMMVKIEGQVSAEMKGLMTTVKGDAMLKAGGGITMIGS